MQFSEAVNNTGIVQQIRDMTRTDSSTWATSKIVNSVNNWLDKLTGYAIASDKNFRWDDTNHTKLPIGTTNLVQSQQDYSFLLDEQGNKIITLTRVEAKDSSGNWVLLEQIDQDEVDVALPQYLNTPGTPMKYDKIADNIVRLYPAPASNVTSGLRFYFQRTPSYFTASDTTKEPGVSPLLHRGFIIAGAYDAALTLGLNNLSALSVELQKEEAKIEKYFGGRNNDLTSRVVPGAQNNR